jgi:hypothetical protein
MTIINKGFSKFTKIFDQGNYRMHTHGIVLILWCLMPLIQPFLIRARMNSLHKTIGKFSYVLVPILIFNMIDLLRYILNGVQLGTIDYFFIALVISPLIAFVFFYGLAMCPQKKSTIHVRYIVCTIYQMFTPVTDRFIGFYKIRKPYLLSSIEDLIKPFQVF